MALQRRAVSTKGVLSGLAAHRQFAVLLLAVGLSVAMMLLNQQQKATVARTITFPLFLVGQRASSWTEDLASLQSENEALKAQNAALALQVQRFQEEHLQSLRLRKALGFRESAPYRLLPAEVIARDPGRMANSVLINVGARDGVRRMMPVVTPDGLVGRILEVVDSVSIVQLLLDPDCRVSALVQNQARDWGIVVGEEGRGCRLENLSIRAQVSVGDVIVSAGMGGVYPNGLKVGTIKAVGGCEHDLFRSVEVEPCVSFQHLEEVFVVLKVGA